MELAQPRPGNRNTCTGQRNNMCEFWSGCSKCCAAGRASSGAIIARAAFATAFSQKTMYLQGQAVAQHRWGKATAKACLAAVPERIFWLISTKRCPLGLRIVLLKSLRSARSPMPKLGDRSCQTATVTDPPSVSCMKRSPGSLRFTPRSVRKPSTF